jgi:hypothetical protein
MSSGEICMPFCSCIYPGIEFLGHRKCTGSALVDTIKQFFTVVALVYCSISHLLPFFFFGGGTGGRTQCLVLAKQNTLLLEPCPQPFMLWLFFK